MQNEPWCFFKSGPPVQYIVHDIVKTQLGVKVRLLSCLVFVTTFNTPIQITLEVNSTSDSTSKKYMGILCIMSNYLMSVFLLTITIKSQVTCVILYLTIVGNKLGHEYQSI